MTQEEINYQRWVHKKWKSYKPLLSSDKNDDTGLTEQDFVRAQAFMLQENLERKEYLKWKANGSNSIKQ